MGLREGADGSGESGAKLVGYLQAILFGKHPVEKVGPRNAKELRTIAEGLDHLASGRLPELADLLMQRFKALEQAVHDGHWTLASHLELVEDVGTTLAGPEEQRDAARSEMAQHRLLEARRRTRDRR